MVGTDPLVMLQTFKTSVELTSNQFRSGAPTNYIQ